jgi:uncharacterized membrane protein YphA (DoxX/SURF4 family)
MKIAVWIVQVLLAALFLFAGVMKLVTPLEAQAANGAWVTTAGSLVYVLGVLEVLGGIGLVIPALTRIKPVLTPIAAVCCCIIMVGATVVTAMEQGASAVLPAVLALLCAFVAWARFVKVP